MAEEGAPPGKGERGGGAEDDERSRLPFPDSLCHSCAAPARYITTKRSVFIYCPIFKRYPPQPVRSCDRYVPKPDPAKP